MRARVPKREIVISSITLALFVVIKCCKIIDAYFALNNCCSVFKSANRTIVNHIFAFFAMYRCFVWKILICMRARAHIGWRYCVVLVYTLSASWGIRTSKAMAYVLAAQFTMIISYHRILGRYASTVAIYFSKISILSASVTSVIWWAGGTYFHTQSADSNAILIISICTQTFIA